MRNLYNFFIIMQAIYDAILSIPDNPLFATRQLVSLSKSMPNFIPTLKTMALQLYHRLNPQSVQQLSEYQTITKQMLTLFNRFVIMQYKEKGHNFYLQIQNYYVWIIDILISENISLSSKKTLVNSLIEVINSINYSLSRIQGLVDYLINHGDKASHSIFIYFQALLNSNITINLKIQSLKLAYEFMYYSALGFYKEIINFYKNQFMEIEVSQKLPNSNFTQKLKENQYILLTICSLINFIYNLSIEKKDHILLKDLAYEIILHPDMASYLSKTLKIELDLFDSSNPQNLYGLNILILNNLRNSQKIVINKCKAKCLSTLKLILSITDKHFNLKYTDKLLMKQLPNLANLILKQLFICSHNNLVQKISIEVEINTVLSSMFDLLCEIVKFQDLNILFQQLNVQNLIRLTVSYMKTYEEELQIYENEAEEYFHLIGYICSGKVNKEDHEIDLTLGQFCMKRQVSQFIKQMSRFAGFQSLLLEICCDYIKLQKQIRKNKKTILKQTFLDKYNQNQQILECFNLQSTLFTFTILLQNSFNEVQKRKNLLFLLETIQLDHLTDLQQCRIYMCLGIYNDMFKLQQIQKEYYFYISKVYTMTSKSNSLYESAYHFIISLFINNDDTEHYKIFLQKILIQMAEEIININHKYLITSLLQILNIKTIKQFLSLRWLNLVLTNASRLFNQDISNPKKEQKMMKLLQLKIQLLKIYNYFKSEQDQQGKRWQIYFKDEEKEYDEFKMISSAILTQENVLYLLKKLDSYHHIQQQDEQIIYLYGQYLFSLLIYQLPLNDSQMQLILKFTLKLLTRQTDGQSYLKKISFELIYQLINISVFNFNQEVHQIIYTWMKNNYFKGEVMLNRVVIILQELYYYVSNNIFQKQYEFVQFYSNIFEIIQKKYNAAMVQSLNLVDILQRQTDKDIRKINQNLIKIDFNPTANVKVQMHPITIIRLYNTILLNPYFDINNLHKFSQLFDRYAVQIVPTYDLTIAFLSFSSLVSRYNSFIIIPCFNFLFQLLKYNAMHDETHRNRRQYSNSQKDIANITKQLRSSITITDPYLQFHKFIQQLCQNHEQTVINNSNQRDQIKVDLIDYIKGNKGILSDIMKISMIRKVNDKSRVIVKVKKQQYQQ